MTTAEKKYSTVTVDLTASTICALCAEDLNPIAEEDRVVLRSDGEPICGKAHRHCVLQFAHIKCYREHRLDQE